MKVNNTLSGQNRLSLCLWELYNTSPFKLEKRPYNIHPSELMKHASSRANPQIIDLIQTSITKQKSALKYTLLLMTAFKEKLMGVMSVHNTPEATTSFPELHYWGKKVGAHFDLLSELSRHVASLLRNNVCSLLLQLLLYPSDVRSFVTLPKNTDIM